MRRGAKPAKAKVEAKPPATPKSAKNEGSRVHDLEKRLAEALKREAEAREQQTATAEILRVISSSPTDVQPVFDAIVGQSLQLIGGFSAAVFRLVGEELHLVAYTSTSKFGDQTLKAQFPRPAGALALEAIRQRTAAFVSNTETDPRMSEEGRALARARGWSAQLMVPILPILRQGKVLGIISVTRRKPGGFTADEIGLLQTFADQAVIAIENVRLFNDTKEALERQTATSEILRVISSSPTDVQPVFEAIAESAARLCDANDALIRRVEDGKLRRVAQSGSLPRLAETEFLPIAPSTAVGEMVLERRTVHIHDVLAENERGSYLGMQPAQRRHGIRTVLAVPLIKNDTVIGGIVLRRTEVRPFTDTQIALLQTFADQAVIAIENVRLFTELRGRNRDLTEALAQQTATSDILRVISQSHDNVQPVFDTIAESAAKLCDGLFSGLMTFDGELIHLAATYNWSPAAREVASRMWPTRPNRGLATSRAILDRAVVHVPDIDVDYQDPASRQLMPVVGYRSVLAVPMLRDGFPLGVVAVSRAEAGPFSDSQIALLKTFADQAVIAIENARLFSELQARTQQLTRSVEQLTALGEVGRAVSSTLDLGTLLDTIVSRACQLASADACSIYEYDAAAERFQPRATHSADAGFIEAFRAIHIGKGEGLMGRSAELRQPAQVPDIMQPGAYESRVRDILMRFGCRALLAVPLLREDQLIGSLTLVRKTPGEFLGELVEVLKTFATQSALAIQNARLFREIADKSRQLEVASQHKSEFLANMSHELRTPLNAIIGFSEVLTERMFGELNEKQEEYLKDIYASGQHLLSLINDILDLSKIEAGRMELELTNFDLPQAINNALMLVRDRAARRGIALDEAVDQRLGQIRGDERKIKQVLLNLLSNALKFTPEGGRVDVRAGVVDGKAEISVSDTGVGIAPEDQQAVFEEFRQVGTADKKVEGTGLGLTLSRKFIELHGGKIWVKSQVGVGSTFTFTLPLTT